MTMTVADDNFQRRLRTLGSGTSRGGEDSGRRGQRLSMIAAAGGGGGGQGRAAMAAAGEGMSIGNRADVCFFGLCALRLLPLALSLKPQQHKDFLLRREGQTTHYGLRKILHCAATKATLILADQCTYLWAGCSGVSGWLGFVMKQAGTQLENKKRKCDGKTTNPVVAKKGLTA
jgi:hypothetical protein